MPIDQPSFNDKYIIEIFNNYCSKPIRAKCTAHNYFDKSHTSLINSKGGDRKMAQGQRTNRKLIPQASQAMEQFKWETAGELGVQVPQGGYMGDLPSRVNGAIGGNMVKKMIAAYEQSLAQGQQPATPQVTNQNPTP